MTDEHSDSHPREPVRVDRSGPVPVIEVTVAAPVAAVWPHLRDKQLIRRWHGWEMDGLDEEIDVIYLDTVTVDDEAHVLTGTFPGPDGPVDADRFEAVADGPDRTIVRITRGPLGIDATWDGMYDDVTHGWISFLAQLRFAVEQHLGEDRQTVFVGAFGGPLPRALDLLGLDETALAAGDSVQIAAADAPPVGGTVWFSAEGQVGVTVPEYGPGLVLVADKPGAEPGAATSSMVIVTTYGLPAAEHQRVGRDWTQWWSAHHADPAAAAG